MQFHEENLMVNVLKMMEKSRISDGRKNQSFTEKYYFTRKPYSKCAENDRKIEGIRQQKYKDKPEVHRRRAKNAVC